MQRPAKSASGEPRELTVRIDPDSVLLRRAPMLLAMLTDEAWDDGTPRITSTFLLFLDAGRLKACLTDRDLERSVFVSGASLEEILDTLESGLEGDCLEWRKKPGRGRK